MLPLILGLIGGGLIVSAFTEDNKYAQGGSIPNNYKGKTAEQVWDEWTVEQKEHFYKDNIGQPNSIGKNVREDLFSCKYDSIKKVLKKFGRNDSDIDTFLDKLKEHISEGQYAKGGEMAKGGEVAKIKSVLAKNNNSLVVVCKSEGNPDYKQYAPISDTKYFPINTLQEAAQKCREYIDENDLGGGNWAGGDVLDINGKVIAHVTYNGRVWNTSDYFDKNKKEFTGEELTKSYYKNGGMMAKGGKIKKETMIKKEVKKSSGTKKANPQANKLKEVIAHAKATRKDGEAWKAAVARAWKEMK